MTGVGHASEQGYLGFRKLVNAADKFPMRIQRNIQRWGDEENPVALRLQTRCLEGCESVAKCHSPKHVTMQRSFTTVLLERYQEEIDGLTVKSAS